MASNYRFSYTCDAEADLAALASVARTGEIAFCTAEGTYWKKGVSSFTVITFGYLILPFLSGTVTLTNMTLADAELPATNYRLKLDLAGYVQYRATMRVATQGVAASDVRFQGSTDDSSFGNLDGSAGPEVSIFGTGEKDTGWVTLATAYRVANVRIRMMGKDGDGVADPILRQVVLHFR